MALMLIFTIIASYIALSSAKIPVFTSNYGVCFDSPNLWISAPIISWCANILSIIGIVVMLILMNRAFNYIRGVTWIYASVFLLLEFSMPSLSVQFFGGTLLCLVTLLLTTLLFSTYQNQHITRRIYLIFVIISFCSLLQYSFIFLIPAFLIGLVQMRSFSLRASLAAICGLITPFWILIGLGIVGFEDFTLPHIVSIFSDLAWGNITILIVSFGGTLLIGIVLLIANMLHIFKYKLQIRAYNGFIIILLFTAAVMIGVDYQNMLNYIPLLNCCVAIQVGHFYTINTFKRRYIPIALFMVGYITLYVWRIFL